MKSGAAVKSRSQVQAEGRVDDQIMKVGFAAMGITSCVIGLWAAACIVSGIVVSGGPVSFLASWFQAVGSSI